MIYLGNLSDRARQNQKGTCQKQQDHLLLYFKTEVIKTRISSSKNVGNENRIRLDLASATSILEFWLKK